MPLLIEELNEECPPEEGFRFHFLPDAKFSSFGSDKIQPILDKWGFGPDMAMCTFRSEQPITPDTLQAMLDDFFKSREVIGALAQLAPQIRVTCPDKVRVHWERVHTKTVSMGFLNKFEDAGAIGPSGHIRGRIEEDLDGVPICNIIREIILCEESELYDTFSEADRKEFLFRIFSHLVFGGASNQWEDHVEEYLNVTKAVYKDLLTVRRNDTGDVEVLSHVCALRSLGHGGQLFRHENPLNFCYIIADPLMRHIRLWYFSFQPVW